ncbi:tumor necrosis factor receptor superfamily member 14 isoform X1 [Oryzias melastigma]|uniref:tumor necrosis factor receptor superfamily member 14 isoform X1 n=1 Tax=Oryzias melastigma TaxID=30732 RepID=UPI000CF817B0|nr:tumor necrosis factor receptor superfamily member 14 isoform X1 [Oryzias melastigma]
MISSLLILVGLVSVLSEPASSCGEKEFRSKDGFCCPMCNQGLHVSRDCTEDLGTKCQPCPEGTFTDKPNGLKSCSSCTLCTGHGLFTRHNCTATSDTVCWVVDGYFCRAPEISGCSLAEKHSQCKSGQKTKEPGSSTADTVCEDCPPGSFSVDGLNCTRWTECSESERRERDGSSVSDVVCSSASRNHVASCCSFGLFLLSLIIATFIKELNKNPQRRLVSSLRNFLPEDV